MTVYAQRLHADGYRSFGKPETLELAVPNGKPGSGLTVLVGPNRGDGGAAGAEDAAEAMLSLASR